MRMDAAGQPLQRRNVTVYVKAAADIAWADLQTMRGLTATGATAHAVIGTLLTEPVLVSLRRMAQENLARRRTTAGVP